MGSPYHPSSAPQRPKQNSNFCFLAQANTHIHWKLLYIIGIIEHCDDLEFIFKLQEMHYSPPGIKTEKHFLWQKNDKTTFKQKLNLAKRICFWKVGCGIKWLFRSAAFSEAFRELERIILTVGADDDDQLSLRGAIQLLESACLYLHTLQCIGLSPRRCVIYMHHKYMHQMFVQLVMCRAVLAWCRSHEARSKGTQSDPQKVRGAERPKTSRDSIKYNNFFAYVHNSLEVHLC